MRINNCSISDWRILLLGLFITVIVQGCTNEVVLKCSPGKLMASSEEPPGVVVGGCNPTTIPAGPIPSGTICKDATGKRISCPQGASCTSSSTKCKRWNPGDIDEKPCKTIVKLSNGATTGQCYCGIDY